VICGQTHRRFPSPLATFAILRACGGPRLSSTLLGRSPIWQHRSAPAAIGNSAVHNCATARDDHGHHPQAARQGKRSRPPCRERQAGARCSAMPSQLGTTGWRRIKATPRQRAQSTKCGGVRAIKDKKAPLERPADAEVPDQPPRPRVITMDTSTEALQRLLADNPRGLLHVRDELAGWLGSFDRYGGNGAYVSDRIKFNGVPLRIKHTSLAILGGMVPDRLRAARADADDGLPARFIFVWPDPVPIAPLCECSDADAKDRRTKLKAFPVINARVPDVAPQFLSSRDWSLAVSEPLAILGPPCWVFSRVARSGRAECRCASRSCARWGAPPPVITPFRTFGDSRPIKSANPTGLVCLGQALNSLELTSPG
jgi:hypothetical protein